MNQRGFFLAIFFDIPNLISIYAGPPPLFLHKDVFNRSMSKTKWLRPNLKGSNRFNVIINPSIDGSPNLWDSGRIRLWGFIGEASTISEVFLTRPLGHAMVLFHISSNVSLLELWYALYPQPSIVRSEWGKIAKFPACRSSLLTHASPAVTWSSFAIVTSLYRIMSSYSFRTIMMPYCCLLNHTDKRQRDIAFLYMEVCGHVQNIWTMLQKSGCILVNLTLPYQLLT